MFPANFTLFEGNRKTLAFRLRKTGGSTFYNVSAAQQIRLDYSRVGDTVPLPSILADRTTLGADWTNGRVLFTVDTSNLTARHGTYRYALVVIEGAEESTYHADFVEVMPNPIPIQPPTLPTGIPVAYSSAQVEMAPNLDIVTIHAGQPVARSTYGIILAGWGGIPADGVAVSDAAPGFGCLYVGASSKVRLVDWTAAIGTGSLPAAPSQPVYLGPTGSYVATAPTGSPAAILQVVGEVDQDSQTLAITLDYLVTF